MHYNTLPFTLLCTPPCYKKFGGVCCIWLLPLLQSSTVCYVKFRQIEGNGRKLSHRVTVQQNLWNEPYSTDICVVPLKLITLWPERMYSYSCITVRKFERWRYCLALCDEIFDQSLYLTKLYVTRSFAIASSVTYSEICQKFPSGVHTVQCTVCT